MRPSVPLSMLTSAAFLKKCALVALDVIAEEGRDGVPGLGDEWKMACLTNASFGGSREGNACNDALHVIGFVGAW